MTMHYSPASGGFYPESMLQEYESAGALPADLIEVSDADYAALMVANSAGKRIAPGAGGYPMAVSPPPPTAADVLAANQARSAALVNTAASAISVLGYATDPDIVDVVNPSDVASLKLWKQYRVALSKLDLAAGPVAWPAQPAATQASPNI